MPKSDPKIAKELLAKFARLSSFLKNNAVIAPKPKSTIMAKKVDWDSIASNIFR